MSWRDRITDKLKITTGDGKEYNLLWKLGGKSIEYNIAAFEFPNIEGTLIRKNKPKGKKYEIDIVFQGDDHIEQYDLFENSAKDTNPITIIHPVYGLITVQLLAMEVINAAYNVTDVKMSLQETISANYPTAEISAIDAINESNDNLGNSIVENVTEVSSTEINTQEEIVDGYNNNFDPLAQLDEEKENLSALTLGAKLALADAVSEPAAAAESVIELANFPSTVSASITSVFSVVETTVNDLLLLDFDNTDNKGIFEKNSGSLIGGLCNATAIKAPTSFETKTEVLNYTESLISLYNDYIIQLDELQTDRADTPDSYVPNFNNMKALDDLINLTVSNLFFIAFSAKQERTIRLDNDSNIILLTKIYYGLDNLDLNIDKFISSNNIGPSELFILKKGRQITYFV